MSLSYLDNIQDAIVTAIGNMTGSPTTQEEDFSKVTTWPLYNVYLAEDEVSNDDVSRANMRNFENIVRFEIKGFNKLTSVSTDSVFEIDTVLNRMLNNIKKMIGENPQLTNLVGEFSYVSSRRVDSGGRVDILLPKYLSVIVEVGYSQDRETPTNPAY